MLRCISLQLVFKSHYYYYHYCYYYYNNYYYFYLRTNTQIPYEEEEEEEEQGVLSCTNDVWDAKNARPTQVLRHTGKAPYITLAPLPVLRLQVLKLAKKLKESRRQEKRQMMHAAYEPAMLHTMHKRATHDYINLAKALTEVAEDEEVMDEAVWRLMEYIDQDGCLLKLLCYLQEKSVDALTPEEGQLMDLFPAGVPWCEHAVPRCNVEEAQLVKAFLYTWHLQNTL